MDQQKIADILAESPSVALLRLRNRELIIAFFVEMFYNRQGVVPSEELLTRLADFLEFKQLESDEESEILKADTYEEKAKKYVKRWTSVGFLTNYQDERGDVFYELSAHSSKALDWLVSLEKQEYVGTESKFKNIFHQLEELVEFTNEDVKKRLKILQARRKAIDKQIKQLKAGEDIKVFEDYEIVPRFNQITQSAKELLSDFKEVEDNFKEITKEIYRKHADESLTKSHILDFTFDALDELKDSQQGKSFYAFWSFLLNPALQTKWANLTAELYQTLERKGIPIHDVFLKGMKKHLHTSGQKVYKANDKMADKLSRIIRENRADRVELTKQVVQEIKTILIDLSQHKKKRKQKPRISIELETKPHLHLPFERKLTFERKVEATYEEQPSLARANALEAVTLDILFKQNLVDKERLRKQIHQLLQQKTQTTLMEVIEVSGGIQKGLPEVFGYLGVVKEFKYLINENNPQQVIFDKEQQKSISIPEVILSR